MSFSRMWTVFLCHLSSVKSNIYLTSAHALEKGQINIEIQWVGINPEMSLPSQRLAIFLWSGYWGGFKDHNGGVLGSFILSHSTLSFWAAGHLLFTSDLSFFSLWRYKDSALPSLFFIILSQPKISIFSQ